MDVVEVGASEWARLLGRSPQATIFSSDAFLALTGEPCRLVVMKGEETLGGMAITPRDGIANQPRFQQYGGPLFDEKLGSGNLRKRIEGEFSVLERLSEYLAEHYASGSFNCHSSIVDIRPLKWVNYHQPEGRHFVVDVLYTSIVDISDPDDRSGWKQSRRACLSRAVRAGVRVGRSSDVSAFRRLYRETFARQDVDVADAQLDHAQSIVEAGLKSGSGVLVEGRVDDVPAGMAFFLVDSASAYYLFGATDPAHRSSEVGTMVMAEAFVDLAQEEKVREVDMVGVNSPQRGSYKLSFGGRLVPYFAVSFG